MKIHRTILTATVLAFTTLSTFASDEFPHSLIPKEVNLSQYYRFMGLSFLRTKGDYPTPYGPTTKDAILATKSGTSVSVALYTFKDNKLQLVEPVRTFPKVKSGPTIVNRAYQKQQINCVQVVTEEREYYFTLVDGASVEL